MYILLRLTSDGAVKVQALRPTETCGSEPQRRLIYATPYRHQSPVQRRSSAWTGTSGVKREGGRSVSFRKLKGNGTRNASWLHKYNLKKAKIFICMFHFGVLSINIYE